MYQNNSAVLYGIVGERFAENGKLVDNPMLSLLGFYNAWVGGENLSLAYSVFYTLLPVAAALPYAWSFFLERKTGYLKNVATRVHQDTVYHRKNDCDVPLRHIDGTDPPLSQRPACQRNAAGLSAGGQLRRLYAHRLRRSLG